MFKKVILGLGIVASLATSGFAFDKQKFCNSYEYFSYQYIVDESFTNSSGTFLQGQKIGIENAGNKRFGQVYGQMSTDFSKDGGFGYSVNMSWGNVMLSFAEYMRYAHSNEDKKDLVKFYLSSQMSELKRTYKDQSINETIYNIIMNTYNDKQNGEIGTDVGELLLTDTFARSKGETKQIFGTFVKKIINKDYAGAKQYIKQVNSKSGINKIYSEFEDLCEK